MDRLEAMQMLLAVAQCGGFSAAARQLQVPLTTLSRKIADLEQHLGARLLVRTTRKVALTDAGSHYVAAARRILEQVEEAEQTAAGEYTAPRGELVLSAPAMFGRLHVLPVVGDFLAQFPDIYVRLNLSDRNVVLPDEHVDMAVRIARLPDSSLTGTTLGNMRTVTCASPGLLARSGIPQTPEDLMAMPCVMLDSPLPVSGWRYRATGRHDAVMQIPVAPRLTLTSTDAAVEAGIRGIGVIRLLHYQVAAALARGTLQIILAEFERPPTPVTLLHAASGLMPVKMRRFHDFAVPRLRAVVQALAS